MIGVDDKNGPGGDLASLAMIERLVGMPTVSRDSNLPLVEYARDYLAGLGFAVRLIPGEGGRKANLFASIGPAGDGGVILSGHTDVVPVDGQDWSSDPFRLTRRDGRLYGRGTCDMKSFVAVALALAPAMAAARLKAPIHLAFSYDEEVGCLGVRPMLAELARQGLRAAACIVGEPTGMQVVSAHKGKHSWRTRVRGFECHSSLAPTGVNAVEYAAELIAFLRALARRKAAEGPFDPAYDVPHTTVHVGTVNGGTALNIVPLDCAFDWEIRYLPGDDPLALKAEVEALAGRLAAEMQARRPATGITFEDLSSFPGLATPEDAPVVQLAKALSGANATAKVAFGTEAGLFQEAGFPTVVCGPGSIDQAHKPDEFIALDQVARCEAFVARLIARLAA